MEVKDQKKTSAPIAVKVSTPAPVTSVTSMTSLSPMTSPGFPMGGGRDGRGGLMMGNPLRPLLPQGYTPGIGAQIAPLPASRAPGRMAPLPIPQLIPAAMALYPRASVPQPLQPPLLPLPAQIQGIPAPPRLAPPDPTPCTSLPPAPSQSTPRSDPPPSPRAVPTPSPRANTSSPRATTSSPRAVTPSPRAVTPCPRGTPPCRSPARSPSSPASARIKLMDLNPHLLCVLCGGYLVDATTIIECLHSFCRTCIYRYLGSSKFCPICDVQVHKTKPLINCRTDNTLQTLVYKLVPGLFKEEMKRRREYYAANPGSGPPVSSAGSSPREKLPEENKDPPPKSEPEKDKISVCLQHSHKPPIPKSKRPFPVSKDSRCDIRYLLCPPDVAVSHLKKFLRLKFDLGEKYKIDLYYSGDMSLKDRVTLEDIAVIYAWKKLAPLKLYWVVQDVTIPLPESLKTDVKHKTPKPQKRKASEALPKDAKKKKVDHENAKQKPTKSDKSKKSDASASKRRPKSGGKGKLEGGGLKKNNKVAPLNPDTAGIPDASPSSSARRDTQSSSGPSPVAGEDVCKFAPLNNNLVGGPRLESDNIDSGISDSQADSDRSTDGGDVDRGEPHSDIVMETIPEPTDKPVFSNENKEGTSTKGVLPEATPKAASKNGKCSKQANKNSNGSSSKKKTPRPKKVTVRSGVRKRLSPAQQIRLKKLKQSPPRMRKRPTLKKSPLGVKLPGILRGGKSAGKVSKSSAPGCKVSSTKSLKQAVSDKLGQLKRAVKSRASDSKKGDSAQKS